MLFPRQVNTKENPTVNSYYSLTCQAKTLCNGKNPLLISMWYKRRHLYISWINHENADGIRMAPGYHQKSILGCSCYTSCINLNEKPWGSWQLMFRCNISCFSVYTHRPLSCLGTTEENLVPSSWHPSFRCFYAFIRSPLICFFSRIKRPSSFLISLICAFTKK